ncbi:MAG TPA: chemotaxis protein CheA, partial [Gammaproteobacteria bacterium]|nr:chemotaxis protein CheA [Gammaproteobacteria bacterium]
KEINENEKHFYRIRFTPDKTTFTTGFDVTPILRELQSYGDYLVTTHISKVPPLVEMNPEECYLKWDVTLVSQESISTIEDIFIFVQDDWDVTVEQVHFQDTEEHPDRLGDLLVSRGILSSDDLEHALEGKQKIGQILSEKGLVDNSEIDAALNEQKMMRQLKQNKASDQPDSTVKVPASRLDKLMNLVGELVIVQARLNQVAHREQIEDINAIAEELDHLTTQMRDQTFSIRMLPIGTTFGRFRRLVRDLSRDLNKKIELQTFGAETELDKMVIDKLGDPLVHLIRNSIDHGIETAAERKETKKPAMGVITLSAEHSNSHVIIKIKDDGKGLNTQIIRQKAIDKHLIKPDDHLTDEQIHQLIFEPGFSTAQKVSDISGRGVGMDVVRKSIVELGGSVSINSHEGYGTEFTVRLPMTLAIIEGLMVMVGDEHYVLPLSSVEECIEMPSMELTQRSRKRLVDVRGEQIPFLYLREWFSTTGNPPAIEQVVITHIGEERFGFCVDEVIGQYQTVIKRLGKLYEGTVGFSGATILGDGSVAMILDPQALMDTANNGRSQPELRVVNH